MTRLHHLWIKRLTCSQCQTEDSLKVIIVGMSEEDFNYNLYISAGCVISEDQGDIGCVQCGWEGFQSHFSRALSARNCYQEIKYSIGTKDSLG